MNTNAHLPVARSRRLRIAQLALLYECVPPKLYGGTERVVSYITEELVNRGHEVTLFASGDSQTSAKLVPGCREGLRISERPEFGTSLQLAIISKAYEMGRESFDIIHSHLSYWTFPFSRITGMPTVSTMHGRLDTVELRPIFDQFPDAPLVSISNSQRLPLPDMNWIGTVYHGLPPDLLTFNERPGQYLAFIGRIAPEKRPDLAIEIARQSGVPLKIAAKIDAVDRDYFEREIKHLIQPPHIEYIGELNDADKSEFLGKALALLFPIDWPEPFGLAMVEALACGTPVLARPCGSVAEIIQDGINGFIASDIKELAVAVHKIDSIAREQCRRSFEEKFTSQKMVEKYELVYEMLIESDRFKRPLSRGERNVVPRAL